MRKIIILAAVALSLPLAVAAQGIVFEPEGNFAAAIQKARKEGKTMFVDFYTDWCGPCKQMSEGVFPLKAVGDVFNRNFVNVQVNAEKGEGVKLAGLAGIKAYPTMLFLNPEDGSTLHTILGYKNAEELLDEVRQLEDSGKYGGLEQMRAEFEQGRSDVGFLVDYFRLLPREGGEKLRSAVAVRYLQNVPAETFKSDDTSDIVFIGGTDGIMKSLTTWDDGAMYRMIDMMAEKLKEGGTGYFPSDYNIGMAFSLELVVNSFMERAISNADEALLEKTLAFQKKYREALNRGIDGDTNIMSGRGIFFATPQMIKLRYMLVNRNDPERFRTEVVSYMDGLMTAMPVDSIKSETRSGGYGGYYYWRHIIIKRPDVAAGVVGSAVWASDDAIKYIIGFANYYWRLMPNDKKTKSTVAKWLNYACAINPYLAAGARDAAPLLVKVGHTRDAIANLETVLRLFADIKMGDSSYTAGVRELIEDIGNDKI